MPVDPHAEIEVTALSWVPEMARGQVRDLRVRWALEEAELPYRTRLLGGAIGAARPDWYYREQPWGQVPAYREGALELFECGAIALHVAEKSEALLPVDEIGRKRAIAWLFAALSTMDVAAMGLVIPRVVGAGTDWGPGATKAFGDLADMRLSRLSDWLGDKEWLEGRFTVGDLMMVATLRIGTLAERLPASLSAYVARGEARPAFQRALAAQLADFKAEPVQ